ncbi:MAG TPA: hypothetical protein VGK85_03515, partial [Myxococcaceae bacterium]
SRFTARALTLPEAVAHVGGLLPPAPAPAKTEAARPRAGERAAFYGEPKHRAVKAFVLEMSAALNHANLALGRHRLSFVPEPPSRAGMLAFLKRAQAEMQRQRGAPSNALAD